jgi:SAM-dependent methyltransferase
VLTPSAPRFTAHNIRLDDGGVTIDPAWPTMASDSWLQAALRILRITCPGPPESIRVADLGCLEGGYSVELARAGYTVVGLDARRANIDSCEWVRSQVDLPNLAFVHDTAWNLSTYGSFDVVFCCGLLYHLDFPRKFLELLARVTDRTVIIHTHVAPDRISPSTLLPQPIRIAMAPLMARLGGGCSSRYALSRMTRHEGMNGRWYTEFYTDTSFQKKEAARWSSWENRRSFWPSKTSLLQVMHDVGFQSVLEDFDSLAPQIELEMGRYYRTHSRGMFVGVKPGR